MSWITSNWQLKLLAFLLSLGLFGAVAFQENPPTTVTVKASIEYDGLPHDKILIHSPLTFPVDVTGTAAAIRTTAASNVTVKVDASHLRNGTITVTGHPQVAGDTVRPLDDAIPIQITVDDRETVNLPIDARVNYGEGWTGVPGKVVVTPASINVTGATSELKDLKAFVAPAEAIAAASADIPSLPIQLDRSGRLTALPNDSYPPTAVDVGLIASLHVEAVQPNQSRQVPVVETPTGSPAPGYRITAINLNPLFVVVTGSASDLSSLDSLNLTAISVDGATQTVSRGVRLNLPANISSQVTSVTVTIVIQRNPVVQPTPTPSPT